MSSQRSLWDHIQEERGGKSKINEDVGEESSADPQEYSYPTFDSYVCQECTAAPADLPVVHYAASLGHLNCLMQLLTADSNSLMSFDAAHRSPLFYACVNDKPECCEFLIDYLAPLATLCDINGDSPLHAAVSGGSEKCTHLLLHKANVPVEPLNKMSMSPAHLGNN